MTKPSLEVIQSALEILAKARVEITLSKYTSLSPRQSHSPEHIGPYPLYTLKFNTSNDISETVLSEGVIVSPSNCYVGVTVAQRESIFNVDIFPVRYSNKLFWRIKDGVDSCVRGIGQSPLNTFFDIQKDEHIHRFSLHFSYETGPKFDYTFIPLEFYKELRN